MPTPVHVLTGGEGTTMLAWMLTSFFRATRRNWRVVIHSDGTLESEHRKQLTALLPTVEFAPDATEEVEKALKKFPRCLEYRLSHALARKCFDIPFLADTKRYIMLDSDVLFFQRPSEILQWVDAGEDHPSSWFNADFQEPCPVRPEEAPTVFGQQLWHKVNSGLCLLRRDSIDFADHEEYLACDRLREGNPWRIEQSLLALSASKRAEGGLLPSTYEVSPNERRGPNCIARHYVGEVRDHFYGEGVKRLAPTLLASTTT